METTLALIVDDSKTAQYLLKRMLAKYDLQVEMADSAEQALSFLSYKHPKLIFLDQHMQGMNGIEALRTIKDNPATALIPVIMYTSVQDDVFLSQARALGALDILTKGDMQPSDLERILQGLKILPQVLTNEGDRNACAEGETGSVDTAHSLNRQSSDLDRVSAQIAKLFEMHIAAVREQINTNSLFITKRLSAILERSARAKSVPFSAAGFESQDGITVSPEAFVNNTPNTVTLRSSKIAYLCLAALSLATVWGGYQLAQIEEQQELANKRSETMLEAKKQDRLLIAHAVADLMSEKNNAKGGFGNAAFLQAISWVQNTDFQFNYGESPFHEAQLANLNNLLHVLVNGGYQGRLTLDINFGNFCLEPGAANSWRVARSEMPVSACKMLNELNPKFSAQDFLSVSYKNFERAAVPVQDGRIKMHVISSGLSVPRLEYPVVRATTTAGEWNNIALRNNRIAVHLAN
jgi:CheY-like chemotaxis protein